MAEGGKAEAHAGVHFQLPDIIDGAAPAPTQDNAEGCKDKRPTCVIVLGMAGSGKTTFVQRLTADLHSKKTPPRRQVPELQFSPDIVNPTISNYDSS